MYHDGISQVANPGLRSEVFDTAELVADYMPLPNMNLRASVYEWDMYNIISLGTDPISGLPQYQQKSHKIIARGTELSLDKTWDSGARLRSSIGIQSDQQQGSHLVNSPYYLGKLNISIPIPLMAGLRAGYELQYYGKRKTLDGTNTDSYFLSNLNLVTDVQWVKGLEATLGFYNLFNEHFQHPAAESNWQNSFMQPGRTVRLRMDYRF